MDFEDAIKALNDAQMPLTIKNLRGKLNQRGSYSTIGKMLEEYCSKQDEQILSEMAVLPKEISDSMTSVIKLVYCKASEAVQARMSKLIESKNEQLDSANNQI